MNKKGEISNSFLALLVVVAIAVSLAGFFMPTKMTGKATDTGNLTGALQSTTAINFTDDTINFGNVAVPVGLPSCEIGTESNTNCTGTAPSNGFTVENIGNENVTLDLATGKNADTLIGGTSPIYQYKVTNKEAGSCDGAPSGYKNVNTTSPGTRICTKFYKNSGNDEIDLDVRLVIPSDAAAHTASDTFTATATAV